MVFYSTPPITRVTSITNKGIYRARDYFTSYGTNPPTRVPRSSSESYGGGAVDTSGSSVEMGLPKGSGYVIGLAIGTGSWVVWAIVFDNLVLGFIFAMTMGLLVFGPMFERGNSKEFSPEQARTVRNLLVAGVLIGVAFCAVLFVRLALMA